MAHGVRLSMHESTTEKLTRLQSRVDELEDLCAELYELGVEVGLPQIFLNRLWTVAGRGNEPHTFDVPMDPVPADTTEAQGGAAHEPPAVAHDDGIADIPLVHAVKRPTKSLTVPRRDLSPLPERKRVMVVDDDPAMLELVLKMLAHENYELLSANSGPEALEAVAGLTQPIDLLITDYVMPVLNGRQLADQMRKRYPHVKVLYETGFTDLLFKTQRETESNAAFIEKPFSARGLLEAARLALFGFIQPPPPPEGERSRV